MDHSEDRRIAHLDMDAFFASVELLQHPQLRGQALVIGGRRAARSSTGDYLRLRDYSGRGVVTTATYEARELGVRSGMGLMKAAQLAPDAILLPPNFDAYRDYSQRFKSAVSTISTQIEDLGIDEIYIDLTGLPEESVALGQRIKAAVTDATGLTASIGISPNKQLAKLCSDLDKPDGLTVLQRCDIPSRIWPLPVGKINGIGPRTTARLQQLGVHSIGDLAAFTPAWLIEQFGASFGHFLHRAAHGIDDRPVVTKRRAPKSVSRETTFERDLHARHDRAELAQIFTSLCERVADDLRRKGVRGRTIGIKLRYADFSTLTRDHSIDQPTRDPQRIRRAAGECLKRVPLEQRLRLLGVRVSGLISEEQAAAAEPLQLEFDWTGCT
ncbi:DNA polymerase IV [Halorhodospira halochloris]|uniref:DNA polymerase IV n=1 Tax=Halorhodospira halochloris TaxID=1052 RepID=A0A110B5X1_HALHR|nr:DNA polymerase IV [Halorhodospira halochloris]MBK1652731.1 DNA polymerase IV [Halorhodospira halochloris]BAU58693.1 DNA polymerase IV [Halorhodospira halochloris]